MKNKNFNYLLAAIILIFSMQSCKKENGKVHPDIYKNIKFIEEVKPLPSGIKPSGLVKKIQTMLDFQAKQQKKLIELSGTPKTSWVGVGRTWPKSYLFVYFLNSPSKMDAATAQAAVIAGMQGWLSNDIDNSPIQIQVLQTDQYNQADVKVGWYKGDHGDGYPFDGPGGILAHGFFPTDGRLHFDDDENWSTDGSPFTIDQQSVATHEFGHILGLDHSECQQATMTAYYFGLDMRKIDLDDFMGYHAIYNKPVTTALIFQDFGSPIDLTVGQNATFKLYWRHSFITTDGLFGTTFITYPQPFRYNNVVWRVPPGVDIISGQGTPELTVRANGSNISTGNVIYATLSSCNVSLQYYTGNYGGPDQHFAIHY